MFLCANCGRMFDFPDEVYDFTSEYFGAPVRHTTSVCPNCGSDEFNKMRECDICGELIPPDEKLCGVCRDLVDDIVNDIKHRVSYVTMRWDLNEEELLSHIVEEL